MSREPEVRIQIRCEGTGFPTEDELDLRYTLEELIKDRGIGEVVDAGSGMGVMDLAVAAENPEAALQSIKLLIDLLSLGSRTDCRIAWPDKSPSPSVPYQPGDCLAIKLEDDDFGAALVLARHEHPELGVSTLVGILRYKARERPDFPVFTRREWLIPTHHSWKGKSPAIGWRLAYDFASMEPSLQVVARIELLQADPTDSMTTSGWGGIGIHPVAQARWDAGLRD